jgi:hypothetical protein
VAAHAPFAEELAGLYYSDYRFLALLGQDSKLDLAFLNVIYCVGGIPLLEHMLVFFEFQYRYAFPHFGEEELYFKRILD